MFAKELSIAGGKHFSRGRSRRDGVLQTIHAAAFHVHALKHDLRDAALAVFEQIIGLCCAGNVARKKNSAGGLKPSEQIAKLRSHLGSVESDDQYLPDLCRKILG